MMRTRSKRDEKVTEMVGKFKDYGNYVGYKHEKRKEVEPKAPGTNFS